MLFKHQMAAILTVACSAFPVAANDLMDISSHRILLAQANAKTGIQKTASDNWLVTPEEAIAYQGEAGFNARKVVRVRAVVPLIDILKPQANAQSIVKAPFGIDVKFKSLSDAAIDPATFKVMYGAFKFDITNRITEFVKVTPDGFSLDNAKIPAGKHRLILQVQDEKQRLAERELRIEVE
ncbi:MAG: hypothetical protein PHH58_11760 [Rhodoferax sp.]|nr:hypothetical protein [Rhodoferax sp.]